MAELHYLSITLPGRNNVREPMPNPTMRLTTEKGTIRVVELTEAQLMAVAIDAMSVINRMRMCRNA